MTSRPLTVDVHVLVERHPTIIVVSRPRRWYKVHTLVLETFGEPRPSPRHHCAHLDGDRQHNHIDNLAWKLPEENEADKKTHGSKIGGTAGSKRLTLRRQLAILSYYARTGMGCASFTQIAKRFRVHRSTVAKLITHQNRCRKLDAVCPLCQFISEARGEIPAGRHEAEVESVETHESLRGGRVTVVTVSSVEDAMRETAEERG